MCIFYNVFVQLYTFQLAFQNFTTIFLHSSIIKKIMASGTPSAQIRIPLTDPLLPPPPFTYSHTILLGGKLIRRRKKLYGGRIIIRERQRMRVNNYPCGCGWTKNSKKIERAHSAEKCRTVPKLHYSIS